MPVVRTFIALPAGIARMPQLPFHLYTFVGSWIWCYALAYIGFALGERWNRDSAFRHLLHQADFLIVGAVVAIGVWWVWRHLRRG